MSPVASAVDYVTSEMHRQIVITGGGLRYFASAWIAIGVLRALAPRIPVQLWMLSDEYDRRMVRWLSRMNVELHVVGLSAPRSNAALLPGTRSEWVLKPQAILSTNAREIIFLDADNCALVNPMFLLYTRPYLTTGAIFWPDYRRTGPERSIWKVMGIPYRDEPEFETGQMVINKERCGEALEFALWMNQRADFFYQHIWGDKDTFRFAWHKFGLPYAMIPHSIQPLTIPGAPPGHGVMCQHDFEGNRIFQHRNMAKWDLLGENPRIPGFLYEQECREYLAELRGLWNGRLNWEPPHKRDFPEGDWAARQRLVRDLTSGAWLLEDRRPKAAACCGPVEEWTEVRKGKPWITPAMEAEALKPGAVVKVEGKMKKDEPREDAAPVLARGLRCGEVTFLKDGVLGVGAGKGFYFWDVEKRRGRWRLRVSGETETTADFVQDQSGGWSGNWSKSFAKDLPAAAGKLRLRRVESEYLVLAARRNFAKSGAGPSVVVSRTAAPLHLANHAFGIGDAPEPATWAVFRHAASGESCFWYWRCGDGLLCRSAGGGSERTTSALPHADTTVAGTGAASAGDRHQ